MTGAVHEVADTRLRRIRARVTRARVAVLAALLAAERALTHREVERRIRRNLGIDRVTIYRVLEWLTARDLAHKISDDDRVWRFIAAREERGRRHAHFKCSRCGGVTCLDGAAAVRSVPVPSGFRSQEIELTVKGLCAGCGPAARRRARRHARQRH